MGTEEGLVKSRDMNPSSLSSLLSPVLPGMRTGGDDPAGGGRAEPRPEPSGQAFRRDAQTTRWCCGGWGTDDSASDHSSQQKSKTTFPKHTRPTGPLSVSIQSRRSRCASNTTPCSAAAPPRGPLTVGRSHPRGCVVTDGPDRPLAPGGAASGGKRRGKRPARREGRVRAMETRPGGRDG